MEESTHAEHPRTDRVTLALRWVVGLFATVIVVAGSWVAYAYASTPSSLRHPTSTHYHFRLQIIADGQAVNFAGDTYQTEFNKDICSALLTKEPVHFHDKLDQFVHIHWNHLTGGIVLKDYGWNLIGGASDTLGYRFDQLPKIVRVPIHGRELPKLASGDRYFVYTGDSSSYTQRTWSDFLNTDLANFFSGKKTATSPFASLVPAAEADSAPTDEQLTELNHVLGSVVIFAQKTPPTNAQIKDRFNNLVPLPMSACGG